MSWLYTIIVSSLMFGSGIETTNISPVVVELDQPVAVVSTFDESERIEKTFPLSSDGKVSVSNINGSIEIRGWDRNEVQVVATKVADTKERLADVEIRFDSSPHTFSVETDYGDWRARGANSGWKNSRLTVNYVIMAPNGAVLNEIETVNGTVSVSDFSNSTKVSAVNGSVIAKNLKGTANLETVNGEVAADFEKLEAGSRISLSTVNGRVNLTLPSDVNATIRADSVNGVITNEFGLPVRKGKYVGRDLYGRIGTGDVQIQLESVNGGLAINKKSDGRTQNRIENLLPQKDKDGDDGDFDAPELESAGKLAAQAGKMAAIESRVASKAAVAAAAETRRAMELSKDDIQKAAEISAKVSADVMRDLAKIGAIDARINAIGPNMARIASAGFAPPLPMIDRKSNSFQVKGTPDITIDAENASVKIIGWDMPEVKYSLMQISNPRNRSNISMTERATDSKVELRLIGTPENTNFVGPMTWRNETRIEIYVPRRSNLTVKTGGEIRVEGVSGKLKIDGGEQSINLRDVNGQLSVNSTDGDIRLLGFEGSVKATTECGLLSLEGNFADVDVTSDSGQVILTLPASSNLSINADAENVSFKGFASMRDQNVETDNRYTLGKGGNPVRIVTGSNVIVRSTESITTN